MVNDLLAQQAEIKARKITRDTSGQFIRASRAVELKAAAEKMKTRLRAEVDAADHAAGRVRVHPHFRPLPHTSKPVEGNGEVLVDLFARAA